MGMIALVIVDGDLSNKDDIAGAKVRGKSKKKLKSILADLNEYSSTHNQKRYPSSVYHTGYSEFRWLLFSYNKVYSKLPVSIEDAESFGLPRT